MKLTQLDIIYKLAAEKNPLAGDDPDDIAEAWNDARDAIDIRTEGTLTAHQLDVWADRLTNVWRTQAKLS